MRQILNANGAPTRLNFGLIAGAGYLATPAIFPPFPAGEGQFQMPVVGGATRLEAVAAQLAAGMIAHGGTCEAKQAVQFAVELIQECNARAHEVTETPHGDTGQAATGGGSGDDCETAGPGA